MAAGRVRADQQPSNNNPKLSRNKRRLVNLKISFKK